MIQKKVCMLGATAVGKTSLVARFVSNLFSDKYHTSIGVKVDKKALRIGEEDVSLLLWDIYGDDDFQKLRTTYLRGAAGYLLVVDSTRRSSLEKAYEIKQNVEFALGPIPFVLVLNKTDLVDAWDLPSEFDPNWTVVKSSAKTGVGVEEAFAALAAKVIAC